MNSSPQPPAVSDLKPPGPAVTENEARLLAVIGAQEEKQRRLTDQLDSGQATVLALQ